MIFARRDRGVGELPTAFGDQTGQLAKDDGPAGVRAAGDEDLAGTDTASSSARVITRTRPRPTPGLTATPWSAWVPFGSAGSVSG